MASAADIRDFLKARAVDPYADDAGVAAMTAAIAARGHRILQIHRLAADDRDHVARLLDMFDPPGGALVVDAGCGIGEVARLMREMRPDLSFALVNRSAAQLSLAPNDMVRIAADLHDIPLGDASAGAVIYCYSLGHALLDRAFAEAARLLRAGGLLFIYDITAHDAPHMIEEMGYKPHSQASIWKAAIAAGFRLTLMAQHLATSVAAFVELVGQETYDRSFRGSRPVAW